MEVFQLEIDIFYFGKSAFGQKKRNRIYYGQCLKWSFFGEKAQMGKSLRRVNLLN